MLNLVEEYEKFNFIPIEKKRIVVNGTGPNSIEITIKNNVERYASILLDNMETKRLIKQLVMQL